MTDTAFSTLVRELVASDGSAAEFCRTMRSAGASLTDHTLAGWMSGRVPSRPRHILALEKITGKPASELLQMMLTDEEREQLYGDAA